MTLVGDVQSGDLRRSQPIADQRGLSGGSGAVPVLAWGRQGPLMTPRINPAGAAGQTGVSGRTELPRFARRQTPGQ